MYRIEVTDAQFLLLRGLVARAAEREFERVRRMRARPGGTHRRDVFASAEALAADLGALETAVELGWTHRHEFAPVGPFGDESYCQCGATPADVDGIDTAAAIEDTAAAIEAHGDHDGWVAGCPVCEREHDLALDRLGDADLGYGGDLMDGGY